MLWDNEFLYVSFKCDDKHIWTDHYSTNTKTFRDDCVELFLNTAPDDGNACKMFEINCLGNLLCIFRNFEKGLSLHDRTIMVPHIAQSISGTVNDDSDCDEGWIVALAVRFEDYPEVLKKKPENGTMWRAGVNPCGGMTNWQDSMWAPEFGKDVGSFHQYLGKLYFSDEPTYQRYFKKAIVQKFMDYSL